MRINIFIFFCAGNLHYFICGMVCYKNCLNGCVNNIRFIKRLHCTILLVVFIVLSELYKGFSGNIFDSSPAFYKVMKHHRSTHLFNTCNYFYYWYYAPVFRWSFSTSSSLPHPLERERGKEEERPWKRVW